MVDHLVIAVLRRNAQATGIPDPYTSVQTTWVPARWQHPGQPPRYGEVPRRSGSAQLLAAGTLARRALGRRRLNAWAAEWQANGPMWSGRR